MESLVETLEEHRIQMYRRNRSGVVREDDGKGGFVVGGGRGCREGRA